MNNSEIIEKLKKWLDYRESLGIQRYTTEMIKEEIDEIFNSPQENRGDTPTRQRSSKLTGEERKVSSQSNGDTEGSPTENSVPSAVNLRHSPEDALYLHHDGGSVENSPSGLLKELEELKNEEIIASIKKDLENSIKEKLENIKFFTAMQKKMLIDEIFKDNSRSSEENKKYPTRTASSGSDAQSIKIAREILK